MTRDKDKEIDRTRAASSWQGRQTLLFVDYEVPHYDLYAGSRTNFMYLELLAGMGFDVKFLPADFRRVEPYSSELNKLGTETLDGPWFRENWENWLQENGQGIDFVFFHKPDPAAEFLPAVKRYTNAAILYQCHDLHYLRLQRKAGIENDSSILEEAKQYEKKEDFIFANSDVLLTFSEVEEKFIKDKFPHKAVFTVPLFFYREMAKVDPDFSRRRDLLFVGSCSHSPNHDGISWFCSEVFPLIRQQLPDIVFNVIGADPPADISALNSKNIKILGRVSEEELDVFYKSARLMVVPLRFGAGVKGKVIETLYKGLPMVSTTIGLEGIRGLDQLATPCDTPVEFAAEVISLYKDTQKLRSLSRLGLDFIADHYTSQKTAERMAEILAVSREEAATRIATAVPGQSGQTAVRLIAFYLPQYHPIPENDEWWGEGFTEWRKVSKAEPLFPGHHQPHVPAELGYYDLREEKTRIAQADLARQYGIEGFCYYHYWFNGRRLLERPLEDLLSSGKPDFPFCICWANENWTRRWDGKEKQILMPQKYSEEDDRNHIRSLIPIFSDNRYIRINGKPFFLVYRTADMPDPARSAEIWREEARRAGIGELHLCRVESMDKSDPRQINFDSALEFAPDWWNKGPQLTAESELIGQDNGVMRKVCANNYVHSYQGLADAMMAKRIPGYKWFRCVTPSWDNWARLQKGASLFLGSTPEKFRTWLSRAIANTNARLLGEERILFINAWNEWAEGCHLEPDQKFGRAYLEAIKQALDESQLSVDTNRAWASDYVRISQLMSQMVSHKYELEELRGRIAQRDLKIEEMLNSTSWKATIPLRWVKQQLINLKALFSR